MSSRHLSRSIAMQSLYEWDFNGRVGDLKEISERNLEEMGFGLKDKTFVSCLVEGVKKYLPQIDEIITKAAPQWPLEQVSLVEKNILRVGLYELIYTDKKAVPPRVAINEAIELAKSFGGPASGKFVNGVLGAVFKEMPEEAKEEKETWVSAIIYRQEKGQYFLAFSRQNSGQWGLFTVPVGKEESFTQALKKMLKQELGLETVRIMKELGERDYSPGQAKITDFIVEVMVEAELKTGAKIKWFDIKKAVGLNQRKSDRKAVKEAINYLQSR